MRFLLPVLVAGAVAGCIPAPYGPYYWPAYPDASATLTKQYCAGKAGPPSILSFAGPEGLRFEVRAFKEYAERDRRDWPLRIALTLPAGAQFRFVSDELEISELSADRGRTVTGVIRVDASTPVQTVSRGATASTALRVEAGLGEERASGYFIRLPPFLLNDRQYELKPIDLELRLLDGGIEPFNC